MQIADRGDGQGQRAGAEILLARSASYCAWTVTLIAPPMQLVHWFDWQKSPEGSRTQSELTLQDWS